MSHPCMLPLSLVLGFIKDPDSNIYLFSSIAQFLVPTFPFIYSSLVHLQGGLPTCSGGKNLQYIRVPPRNSDFSKDMQACVSPTHWSVAEQTLGPGLLQVGSICQAPAVNQALLWQNQSSLWLQAAPGGYRRIQGDVLSWGTWEFHPLPVFFFLRGKGRPSFNT